MKHITKINNTTILADIKMDVDENREFPVKVGNLDISTFLYLKKKKISFKLPHFLLRHKVEQISSKQTSKRAEEQIHEQQQWWSKRADIDSERWPSKSIVEPHTCVNISSTTRSSQQKEKQ